MDQIATVVITGWTVIFASFISLPGAHTIHHIFVVWPELIPSSFRRLRAGIAFSFIFFPLTSNQQGMVA